MTSNLGSHLIQKAFEESKGDRQAYHIRAQRELWDLLRKTIRPEFLNRIDETILFSPLNESEIEEIVRLQLNDLNQKLEERNYHLEMTESAVALIARAGFDPEFGARPIKRAIQRNLLNELSRQLLVQGGDAGGRIKVDAVDDQLVFDLG